MNFITEKECQEILNEAKDLIDKVEKLITSIQFPLESEFNHLSCHITNSYVRTARESLNFIQEDLNIYIKQKKVNELQK
jgi:hypothetical protein